MQKQRKTSRNYPGQLFSTIVLAGGGGATAQLLPEGLRITGLVVAHKATQWGKHKPDWTLPSRFFDTGSRGNRSQSGPCLSLKSMKKLLYSEAKSHLSDATSASSSFLVGKPLVLETTVPISITVL